MKSILGKDVIPVERKDTLPDSVDQEMVSLN